MSWLARAEIDEALRSALDARGTSYDEVGESAYVVRLERARGIATTARLVAGDQSLLVESFFVPKPSERAEDLYRFLLERNGRMHGVHFAIDARGDVYLLGRLPLLAITPDEIDRLLTRLASYSAEALEAALTLPLPSELRREWEARQPPSQARQAGPPGASV